MKKKPLVKAYNDYDFLNSHSARTIRILSEYLEPEERFQKNGIDSTIVFFGSARSMSKKEAKANLEKVHKKIKQSTKVSSKLKKELVTAKGILELAPYYESAIKLSEKFAIWGKKQTKKHLKVIITSGGSAGMMQAANHGAFKAKAKNIGLNISLPFEQNVNPYVNDDLSFEFHYFFMRKFWFLYLAKAIIIMPGGFGTMDEFMEALTLIQTKKIEKPLPIVLFGKKFWNEVVNFKALVKWGVIAKEDLNLFLLTDDIDEAFNYVINILKKTYKNAGHLKEF